MKILQYILIALLITPFFAHAQIGIPLADTLEVILNPETPGSFEDIKAKIESYSFDLSRSLVIWSVDGKEKLRGVGERNFTFRTGPTGKEVKLVISITTPEGEKFSKTTTILPGEVDLVWEADSYVPPFYLGKALPTSESDIRVVAIPNMVTKSGVKKQTSDLVYTWKVENSVDRSISGYGKNSITVHNNIVRESVKVEVSVSSLDGTMSAINRITIPITQSELHFYEERPLEGTRYEAVLDLGASLNQAEGSIRAEPYFVSASDYLGGLVENLWSLAGDPALPSPLSQWMITLRKKADSIGEVSISLESRNKKKLLQDARASFDLNYGKK